MNRKFRVGIWLVAMALAVPFAAMADRFEYDPFGRLTRAVYTDGTAYTFAYDAAGNLTARTAAAGPVRVSGDVDASGAADAVDVQLVINSALGLPVIFNTDLSRDGQVNAIDVQMVINAALGIAIP